VQATAGPWTANSTGVTEVDELTAACLADDAFAMSGPRRLPLCAILGVGLILLIAPLVMAA
jgi:hypothetical protein